MASLPDLQQAWEAGHLSRAEFEQQADALHQQLFALLPALVKSEVHQILIDGEGLRFVMGDEAVALWCPSGQANAAPLQALNFGAHEPDETAVINSLAAGARAIVIAGAGIGYHALRLAQREAKASVHAFEPDLRRFDFLSRNVALNALGERVRAYAFALARQDGLLQRAAGGAGPHCVPALTLDRWAADSGVAFDFIHCAVPEQAVSIFEGARQTLTRQRPRVFCAGSGAPLHALFEALGYRAWELGEYGLREATAEPGDASHCAFLHPAAHARLIDELIEAP